MEYVKKSISDKRAELTENGYLIPSIDSAAGKDHTYLIKLITGNFPKQSLEHKSLYSTIKMVKFKITPEGLLSAIMIGSEWTASEIKTNLGFSIEYLPDVHYMLLSLYLSKILPLKELRSCIDEIVKCQSMIKTREYSRSFGEKYKAVDYKFPISVDIWSDRMNKFGRVLKWMRDAPKIFFKLKTIWDEADRMGIDKDGILAIAGVSTQSIDDLDSFKSVMRQVSMTKKNMSLTN